MPSALLALFAVVLVGSQGCQAGTPPPPRDYYFSPTGSDAAGDGSAGKPFSSIDKANRLQLNPGDRVLFEAGQSFAGNLSLDEDDAGTAAQPVTVGSYGQGPDGRGRATIVAGAGTGVRVENAGGVRVADLVLVGAGIGAGSAANGGSGVEFVNTLRGGRTLDFVRVENVDARGFGHEGVFVHGAPSDDSTSGFSDVAITGCVARGNQRSGIYVAGNWSADWTGRATAFAHRNVRVERCLSADNPGDPTARDENRSGSGILLDGVDGGLVDQCEATSNGAGNRARDGGPVGIWCTASRRVVIQRCKSHRNRTGGRHDGGGFGLDGGVCESVLQYNLSESNDGSGFGVYEYAGAPLAVGNVVRHNVSRDDGRRNGYAGIHVWDDTGTLADLKVQGNTVVMIPAAAGAVGADGGSGAAGGRGQVGWRRALWIQSPVRDVEVSGNVFEAGPRVRVVDVAWGQRGLRLANNAYRLGGDAAAVAWDGREFASLAEWLRTTGEPQAAATPAQAAAPVGGAARADAKD